MSPYRRNSQTISELDAEIAELECRLIAHTISTSDAEIPELERRLIDLRRRRNALAPLSTLPPELIRKIFDHLADYCLELAEKAYYMGENPLKFYLSLSATQFCTLWRDVALGHTALWNHIWMTEVEPLKVFIERSGEQPLYIDTFTLVAEDEDRSGDYDEMMRVVVANIHRIRHLQMRSNVWGERFLWLQNKSAPQLEVLKFEDLDIDFDIPRAQLQPDVMPNLRELHISWISHNLWAYFLPMHLPSVEKLTVAGSVTNEELLRLLHRCINIHTLELDTHDERDFQTQQLVLPNLQYLHLYSPWIPVEYLSCPALLNVNIESTGNPEDTAELDEHFSSVLWLFKTFRNSLRTDIRLDHLSFVFDGGEFEIVAYGPKHNVLITWRFLRSDIGFDIGTCEPFCKQLLQLANTLNVEIRCIDVRGWRDYTALSLFCTLRNYSHISAIRVRNLHSLGAFFSSSMFMTPECTSRGGQLVPLRFCDCNHCPSARLADYPGLKTLILDNVDGPPFDDVVWVDGFMTWLRERKERGLGLKNLSVHLKSANSWISEEVVDRIKGCVQNVIVRAGK